MGQEINGNGLGAEDRKEGYTEEPERDFRKRTTLARSFASVSALNDVSRSLARSFPAVNIAGDLQRSLAPSFPAVNIAVELQRSFAPSFPAVNIAADVRRALAPSFPAVNIAVELQRSFAPSFPAVNIAADVRRALALSFPAVNIAAGFRRSFAPSFPAVNIAADLRRSFAPSFPAVNILGDLNRRLALSFQFEETGWFPHSTFPAQIFDEVQDYAEIDEEILTYYRKNWIEICNEIESELAGYLIDEKEKNVLRQALRAHKNGLHDLVSPTLFTLIERAVRVHLNENKIGNLSVRNEMTNRLSEIPISAFPDRLVGYVGYSLFSHHLYQSIRTDDDRDYFSKISMPNRHAVIHGLFDYEAEKSSLNSIFIACYVFQIITLIKIQEIKRVLDNNT